MAEGQILRRRGILAAAGAVMAGIVAKQAAQPVAAAGNMQFADTTAAVPNNALGKTSLIAQAGFSGNPVFLADASAASAAGVNAIQGIGKGANAAIFGQGGGGGPGMYGQGGAGGDGVLGVAGGATNPGGGHQVGVFGTGRGAGTMGIWGDSDSSIGVYGHSDTAFGVRGTTNGVGNGWAGVVGAGNGMGTFGVFGDGGASAIGVEGQSGSSTGVVGTSTGGYGIYGISGTGIGTRGDTAASGSFGVLGTTSAPNSIALGGIANADGSSCFSGGTANPNAYAAFFQGHVQVVSGAFDVFPMGNKHGLALHPDGTHRTFYSVESPECWVEDFGQGTVTAGKASVKLDADFATLVHTDTYHVFITEHGGHNGLHTTAKTASEFVVEADGALATAKGKSAAQVSGTFSWRVVAKPKTTANVERFAKSKVGDTKMLIPDASKLPPRPAKASLPDPTAKKP